MSFEDRSWFEVFWEGALLSCEDAGGVWGAGVVEPAVESVEPEEPVSFLTWASKIFTAVSRDASLPAEVSVWDGYVWTVTLMLPTFPVIR